jgi:hypothetical protein
MAYKSILKRGSKEWVKSVVQHVSRTPGDYDTWHYSHHIGPTKRCNYLAWFWSGHSFMSLDDKVGASGQCVARRACALQRIQHYTKGHHVAHRP